MLRNAFMVKNSLVVATISLTPQSGTAYRIKNIHCIPNVAVTEFITAQVGKTTVGYYHTGTTILNQLPYQDGAETNRTIFDQMRDIGFPLDIPVGEGETFTLTSSNAWARMTIEYEIWDASDVKSTDVNGSASKEYNFLQYGTLSSTITAAGTKTLDSVHNPVEFPNFPFGDAVPSKTQMTILGVGTPTFVMTGGTFATDYITSTYLKFFKDREVLFDDDKNGFLLSCDVSVKAANTTMYYTEQWSQCPYGGEASYKSILKLPEPLVFGAGEELTVQITASLDGGGGTVAASTIYVCLPINVKHGV